MTAPVRLGREREAGRRRLACGPARSSVPRVGGAYAREAGQAPTLEDLVVGSWDGLRAGAAIACPWCDAEMDPRWSAGAGVVGGRCRRCGTELA